jgi:septal ring factor EnvC (AmiA/AmiB activator)
VGSEKVRKRDNCQLFLTFYFLLLAFCFSLFTSYFSPIDAKDPKKKLSEIEKRLKREKQRIEKTLKKEKSILSEIEKIDRALKKKQKELKNYERRLSQTRSKIQLLKKEIDLLTKKLEKRKRYLKERLRSLYKQRYGDIALILISARDYQDLIRRSKYISFIAYYDSKLMNTYSRGIKDLNLKKRHMEVLQKELEINKNNVKQKLQEIRTERHKKNKLLSLVRSKRSYYERMVKELEESSKKLREMIKRLERQKVITGKGFRALKGRLPWPVNGEVIVPFGKYKDPKFNIPVFKSGIEIKVKKGAIARAIAGGRVVFADWFKGYGQLLIINHGSGYHSLYGNLSEIFHETGDIIKRGTAIGKIGESGLLNVPTLYFEIRYKGKPLNPMQWLRKKKK